MLLMRIVVPTLSAYDTTLLLGDQQFVYLTSTQRPEAHARAQKFIYLQLDMPYYFL